MKTNHQRGYKGNIDSPRWFLHGILVCGDATNGNRGVAKARHGLKKSWKKREKRCRAQDIRNELKELNEQTNPNSML